MAVDGEQLIQFEAIEINGLPPLPVIGEPEQLGGLPVHAFRWPFLPVIESPSR
jgi:hypothetical protein